jgi:hypothetical protein
MELVRKLERLFRYFIPIFWLFVDDERRVPLLWNDPYHRGRDDLIRYPRFFCLAITLHPCTRLTWRGHGDSGVKRCSRMHCSSYRISLSRPMQNLQIAIEFVCSTRHEINNFVKIGLNEKHCGSQLRTQITMRSMPRDIRVGTSPIVE